MPLLFATPAQADDATTPTVVVVTTPGGDDTSYQVPLTTTVTFDGVTYGSVYATTNSVITFGQPDGTYWDYPMTPSISLYSMDWVVYPGNHADEHLVISASDGGFQVDISARPYWLQNATDPTNINIVAAINTDGTVAISYSLTGPSYDGQTRTGVRLTNGSIVTLEEYGIVQVEQPPVLAPVPADPTPTPEPTIEPTPTPTPTIEPTPISTPTAEPTPNPTPIIEPTPTPTIEPTPTSPLAPYIPQGSTLLVEGTSLNVIAPEGQRIVSVTAWYGDPLDSTRGLDVSSNITQMASGQTSITIDSSNIYGDPAPGTVKTLIFLVNYESIPTEPTPIPTLTSTPTQTPTQTPVIIDPTPVVIPEPVITPIPIPTEEPVVVPITEPTVEPTPTTTPTQEPTPTPTQTTKPAKEPETPVIQSTPTPEPVPTPEVPAKPELPVDVKTVDPTTLSDKQVEELIVAANTILATAEQGSPAYQEALQALSVAAKADDPVLPTELASIPGAAQVLAAFNALGNIGADMAPATREEAKKEVLATVVAAGAAINATVGAATTASSSTSTSSGSSGGSSGSSGGSSGGSEGTSSESKSGSSARRKEK